MQRTGARSPRLPAAAAISTRGSRPHLAGGLAGRIGPVAIAVLTALATALPASADDLDVYRARLDAQQKPNILFVLDYSGSMGWRIGNRLKIDVLREAVAKVLEGNTDTINAGFGSLYDRYPSGVRWPISPLDADPSTVDPGIPAGRYTMAEVMSRQLVRRGPDGATGTVGALIEAAQYFRGATGPGLSRSYRRPDRWIERRNPARSGYAGGNPYAAIQASYTVGDGRGEPTYRSPIAEACQVNAIVLISDGQPTVAQDDAALNDIIGTGAGACEDLGRSIFRNQKNGGAGNCGPEVVSALADTPQIRGIADSVVKTYTIGFDVDVQGSNFLKRLARDGKGRFFSASEPDELVQALDDAIDQASGTANQSFVELAVGVDRNTSSSDDRAFMSLFTPSKSPGWTGNLKGYFLDAEGLRDIDGRAAIKPDGSFVGTSRSFWSQQPDGSAASSGGASGRFDPATRRLYTDAGDGSDRGRSLARSARSAIRPDNGSITAADLGVASGSGQRETALEWLQTAPMGDPLHSRSVGVDYGARQVVYVMTNQGLLHAIDATAPDAPGDGTPGSGDASGGQELFAYMPRRLLANLPALAADEAGAGADHVYGLDGGITPWHDDTDGDGIVDAGESLLLILGMRRGGSAYHAIDVGDPEDPRLAWVVDDTTPGFGKLAQSWSRASLVNVRRGTGDERVLVFGGGYDAATLDDASKRLPASGNAVFVVDRDGDRVRTFESADMQHSIAADVTAIDSDSDGLADRLYAADVGGRLWRIDFDDPWASAGTVTRFADLHDDAAPQPLFSAPSVALIRGAGRPFLSVSIGSGDRTDPLAPGTANALFMLRDEDVSKGPPSAPRIELAELHDATGDDAGSTDPARGARARAALEAARGWRIDLAPGEKALSRVVSFEGTLMATTYEPEADVAADPCTFEEVRRFHTVDIATSRAADLDEGKIAEPGTVRWRTLGGQGIPGPALVTHPSGSSRSDVLVGPKIVGTPPKLPRRVYWHAK